MRPLYRFLALLAILSFLPLAQATPSVVSSSAATAFVGNSDYIEFAPSQCAPCGVTATPGSTVKVTAPNGDSITLLRTGTSTTNPGPVPIAPTRFYLTGTNAPTGSSGAGAPSQWTRSGNLATTVPADGTWIIQVQGLTSRGTGAGDGINLPVRLSVASKSIAFGVDSTFPQTNDPQFWNQHLTTGEFADYGKSESITGPDPTTEAQEDPNNAKLFSSSGQTFSAFTLNSEVSCAGTGTFTANGAWLGATGTSFTRYAYVDGNFLGTTDLRAVALSSLTVEENEGAVAAGTDADAGISYNNAAGTSYQFITRTAAQGEVLGAVQWAPSGQCSQTVPTVALSDIHQEDTLSLTASQAQCSQDFVAFSMDLQIGNVLTVVSSLNLYIQDAATGATILTVPSSAMRNIGNRVQYYSDVFPVGAYTAIAKVVLTGVGSGVFYDSAAFNVPRGTCIDSPTDLTSVLVALDNICDNENNTCNFTIDNGTLTAILNNVTEHREHSLELTMVNDFSGLGFDGFLFAIGWMVAMWLLLRRAKAAAALIAMLGLLEEWLGPVMPGDRLGYVMLFILVLWLESFGDHLWKRWTKKEEERESEPL